ncbi:MAG: tripartite tricarboxylate transporter permease [Azospirillaceae bacterium]
MDLFTIGFPTALSWVNLLYCLLGVFLGTFVGVLPGISGLTAVALLMPLSFHLDPTTAIIMLGGLYYGAEYGGSTASILLNLPGTASNAITCLDGYPMARQGRAGPALFITTIASFVGAAVGTVLVMLLAPPLAQFALAFGSAEYFAAMLLGLVAAGTIGQGRRIKSVAMVVLGMILGLIGIDTNTGEFRYTYGFANLYDGFPIVILAMGMFGVAEVIASINQLKYVTEVGQITVRSLLPTRDDMRSIVKPVSRGAAVGSFFGPLPGTGPTIAFFIAYAIEKRVSRDPSRFGKGAVEGIAAPEAANNAAAQTSFIPTLTLGIPGAATMAIMLGALLIHGIQPGPQLIGEHPDLFWGVIASFWIGNVFLLVLNIPMIGLWVRILHIPYRYLYPTILVLICIGVYSLNNQVFDVGLVILFGVLGYALKLMQFEPAPLLIGFILGPMVEENFRRALVLTHGDYLALLERPITAGFLAVTVLLLAGMGWSTWRAHQRRKAASPD